MIDEVDEAGNYQVFVTFLGVLRDMYLKRDTRPAFQSVILAGVYDIKNLKEKLRPEKEGTSDSPWNIAADFEVDMSLPVKGIASMLEMYEEDHHTGMAVYQQKTGYMLSFCFNKKKKTGIQEIVIGDKKVIEAVV